MTNPVGLPEEGIQRSSGGTRTFIADVAAKGEFLCVSPRRGERAAGMLQEVCSGHLPMWEVRRNVLLARMSRNVLRLELQRSNRSISWKGSISRRMTCTEAESDAEECPAAAMLVTSGMWATSHLSFEPADLSKQAQI